MKKGGKNYRNQNSALRIKKSTTTKKQAGKEKKSEETIVSNSRWYDRKANMQTSDVPAVCLRR